MRYYKLLILAITLLLSINFVMADFAIGNISHEIETNYGTNRPIKGWINISLTDHPGDSMLTAFNSSIEILDFLELNFIDPDCFPLDCESTFEKEGSALSTKTFSFDNSAKQFIGIELVGEISKINSLTFDISSDALASCSYPLQIDVLGDDFIEWRHDEITNQDCSTRYHFGCFDQSHAGQILANITATTYCQEITLQPAKAYRIGAVISEISTGQGPQNFQLSLDGEPCTETVVASSSGEISCVIEFEDSMEIPTQAEVCINAKLGSENKYKILFEEEEPICGVSRTEDDEKYFDFEIFAKPQKYSSITESFTFNKNLIGESADSSMNEEILDYFTVKYGNNCTEGCIIPIAILPGLKQDLTLKNLNIEYDTGSLIPKSETKFYLLNEIATLITSDFKTLDLEKANLLTLDEIGIKDLILKLDDQVILEQDVSVKIFPEILAILPSKPSALVSTKFIALMNNFSGNLTYTWDFGDNTTEQITYTGSARHTYPNVGSYNLKLKIQGDFGELIETFSINAVRPSDGINQTIKNYKENIKNLKKGINVLPTFIKTEVEKNIDLDFLKKEVDKNEEDFKDALTDEEFIEIMNKLLALRVPESLIVDFKIESSTFFQIEEQIRPEDLEYLDAGTVEADKSEYYNAMNNWIRENLEATFETETYSFYYENEFPDTIFTYVKINLKTKSEVDYLYIMINGNPAKIITPIELDDKDIEETAKAIKLKDLAEEESITIEFIYPFKIDLDNIPFYISPELDDLDISFEPEICNYNNQCEEGETVNNCRNDCKPWGLAWIYIIVLLIVTFIIYIILQEWYKKNYESHLFKNQNELFNLISFISISENHNLSKKAIFDKLKKQGWGNEKLNYAWKKYKGQRTGMWEIPIFRIFEKRKLKKELQKRRINPQPRVLRRINR